MSVLLTVNIVSHNPAQSSSDSIPLNLQTITITAMLLRSKVAFYQNVREEPRITYTHLSQQLEQCRRSSVSLST